MRIAMLSYSMLFQAPGGLQIQVLETIAALQRRGIQATLIDPMREKLVDYDAVHVFGAINGNYHIVDWARALGVPVVVSPLIRPYWTHRLGQLARWLERLVGKLTEWQVATEYRQIASCLEGADALIALADPERAAIVGAFDIPAEKIRVVPNGIPQRFFMARPQPFCDRFGIAPGFVLCVATIDPHKNELALARALDGSGHMLVVIGSHLKKDEAYVRQVQAFGHVRLMGSMDYEDPLLASAYAAAGVFCLPSLSEVMPLSVLEALAAGTPAVITRHHAMALSGMQAVVREIDPHDERAIRAAIGMALQTPVAGDTCRQSVRQYTWDAVAERLQRCYEEIIAGPGARTSARKSATPAAQAETASGSVP